MKGTQRRSKQVSTRTGSRGVSSAKTSKTVSSSISHISTATSTPSRNTSSSSHASASRSLSLTATPKKSASVASRRTFSSAAVSSKSSSAPSPLSLKTKPRAPDANLYELPIEELTRDEAFVLGRPYPPQKSKLKPVYPFTPHAVDPLTGEYALRPGQKREGVIDLDTPLSRQSLEYKRRIVNSHNNVADPTRVIGDPAVYQSRVEANYERTAMLFDDDMRPFLNRHTRQSEIYRDSKPELRTPRTPLPADTGTNISPTAGVLHAYRMHFVRMYLHQKKRREVWEDQISFDNVYNFDSTMEPIKGALNQDGIQEFMHYVKGVACARNSNFVPTDTMAFLGGLKKMIPLVAKVDEVKVVHVRRRKK